MVTPRAFRRYRSLPVPPNNLLSLPSEPFPRFSFRSPRALPSLTWMYVGGCRIEDPSALDGLDRLTAARRDDREPPGTARGRAGRSSLVTAEPRADGVRQKAKRPRKRVESSGAVLADAEGGDIDLGSARDKTPILLVSKRLGLFSEGEDCTELAGLARICGCSWRSSRQRILYGLKGDTRYCILFAIYNMMLYVFLFG